MSNTSKQPFTPVKRPLNPFSLRQNHPFKFGQRLGVPSSKHKEPPTPAAKAWLPGGTARSGSTFSENRQHSKVNSRVEGDKTGRLLQRPVEGLNNERKEVYTREGGSISTFRSIRANMEKATAHGLDVAAKDARLESTSIQSKQMNDFKTSLAPEVAVDKGPSYERSAPDTSITLTGLEDSKNKQSTSDPSEPRIDSQATTRACAAESQIGQISSETLDDVEVQSPAKKNKRKRESAGSLGQDNLEVSLLPSPKKVAQTQATADADENTRLTAGEQTPKHQRIQWENLYSVQDDFLNENLPIAIGVQTPPGTPSNSLATQTSPCPPASTIGDDALNTTAHADVSWIESEARLDTLLAQKEPLSEQPSESAVYKMDNAIPTPADEDEQEDEIITVAVGESTITESSATLQHTPDPTSPETSNKTHTTPSASRPNLPSTDFLYTPNIPSSSTQSSSESSLAKSKTVLNDLQRRDDDADETPPTTKESDIQEPEIKDSPAAEIVDGASRDVESVDRPGTETDITDELKETENSKESLPDASNTEPSVPYGNLLRKVTFYPPSIAGFIPFRKLGAEDSKIAEQSKAEWKEELLDEQRQTGELQIKKLQAAWEQKTADLLRAAKEAAARQLEELQKTMDEKAEKLVIQEIQSSNRRMDVMRQEWKENHERALQEERGKAQVLLQQKQQEWEEEKRKAVQQVYRLLDEQKAETFKAEKRIQEYEFMIKKAEEERKKDAHAQEEYKHEMEDSFHKLMKRYDDVKSINEQLRRNEGAFRSSIEELKSSIAIHEERYEKLKAHASEKLDNASSEIKKLKSDHEKETLRIQAQLRSLEFKVKSLEAQVEVKERDNQQLTALNEQILSQLK
ncbi:hypothetical protein BZG36_04067 [Bifiguratus adelaidae]|uniref:Transforming acidic coiled-coil-containing protein C-terminal domain-containing protein n=1 Tax=Bifiguratus adelaidae TaxID=1938954 RepID=A0A261XXR3_9FUNG|nr:hypothetical protein BZG36_04067 [Bifiguratus adelaidae]